MKYERGPRLQAAIDEQKEGCCAFCDDPVDTEGRPGPKTLIVCPKKECVRQYHTDYQYDRRLAAKKMGIKLITDMSFRDREKRKREPGKNNDSSTNSWLS